MYVARKIYNFKSDYSRTIMSSEGSKTIEFHQNVKNFLLRSRYGAESHNRITFGGLELGLGLGLGLGLESVASHRSRGPIDNILFGAPLWPDANHSVLFRILACYIISFTPFTDLG